MSDYGVQAQIFGDGINVGRINKARTEFIDKQDCTADVLLAVAKWVEKNHDGGAWIKVGDYRVEITVKKEEEDQ